MGEINGTDGLFLHIQSVCILAVWQSKSRTERERKKNMGKSLNCGLMLDERKVFLNENQPELNNLDFKVALLTEKSSKK